MESLFRFACVTSALISGVASAQWPPAAPYVAIEWPFPGEYHGATPSPIGRILLETETITGEAIAVGLPGDSTEQACDVIADDVDGRIAVIRRGGCGTETKAIRAAAAGASAVLIYNDVEPGSPADTSIVWDDAVGDSAVVSIPVALTRALTGATTRATPPMIIDYQGSGGCFDYNGIADPTDPALYFPLAVGNAWEYVAWLYPQSYRQRIDVISDTLVNGVPYFVLRDARYSTTNPATPTTVSTRLLRLDPETARVGDSCPLDTPFEAGQGGCFARGTPGLKRFASCYAGMGDGGSWEHIYQAGRGLIRSVFYGVVQPIVQPIDIVYSRVDGVEVGTPHVWPVTVDPDATPRVAALRASPQPAGSRVIVSFTLPDPAPAAVAVFDVLGRRVAAYDLGRRPAGAGEVALDVSALAPGRYVVRLLQDGQPSLTAPLVIAR